mgnify:FL=1
MKVHYSSNSNEWYTPNDLYEKLNMEFKFNLDPCATKENAKCDKFYTKRDDGLSKKWSGRVFVNPPYGREIGKWVEKSYKESLTEDVELVVMLIPSRTDTKYWHEWIFGKASVINFFKGRLKFGGSNNSAPFPSALVVFNKKSSGTMYHTINTKGEII